MCIVSLVHDFGQKLPQDVWKLPDALPAFEEIVKRASDFDRITKQPDCFDPEKLKFLEQVKADQPAQAPFPPDLTPDQYRAEIARLNKSIEDRMAATREIIAERESLRKELDQTKVLLEESNHRANQNRADVEGALKDVEDLTVEYDNLKIAYTRMALEGFRRVSVCGSGEYFTQIDIDLPTGPVRFFIDNKDAPLLNGLPYGISDFKGAYDHETQALRLTGAFHPDIDQTLIPEPATVDRVLEVIDTMKPVDLSDIRFGVPHNKKASSF